jgi:RRXRR protein
MVSGEGNIVHSKEAYRMTHAFVPVVDREQRPLMPTTPARARRWIKAAKATAFWNGGLFCVRLNVEPSMRKHQPIAVGIDPGSKKEALLVASAAHTYLKLFPISGFVVEDVKAPTRQGKRHWNRDFSPLQVGKLWFYNELGKLAPVQTMQGFQTKVLRDELGLTKTANKMAEVWQAHCVDAWVLAYTAIGGCKTPDNTSMVCITPLIWHRRQLHKLQPARGGKRRREGGTLSLGVKRGTLIKHHRWGKTYVGGTMNGKLSLHAPESGKRITQSASVSDCRIVKLLRWRTRIAPSKKASIAPASKEGTPAFSVACTGSPQAQIGEIHGDARP